MIEALVETALQNSTAKKCGYQTLVRMAELTLSSGGWAQLTRLGTLDEQNQVLETRLIVRQGRKVAFALPILEQYFGAHAILQVPGLAQLCTRDPSFFDRVRYSYALALILGGHDVAARIYPPLIRSLPGAAAWTLREITRASSHERIAIAEDLPEPLECALRVRNSIGDWMASLSEIEPLVQIFPDNEAAPTVGAAVRGDRIIVGLSASPREEATVEITLPLDISSQEWSFIRDTKISPDDPTWPWHMSVSWIEKYIQKMIQDRLLPIPLKAGKEAQYEKIYELATNLAETTQNTSRISQRDLTEILRSIVKDTQEANASATVRFSRREFPLHDFRAALKTISEGVIPASDGYVSSPWTGPDKNDSIHAEKWSYWVWEPFSEQALRDRCEQVYTAALQIYSALVDTYFPKFSSTLSLSAIMPVRLEGKLLLSSISGPTLSYRIRPAREHSTASINLGSHLDRENRLDRHFEDDEEYWVQLQEELRLARPKTNEWTHVAQVSTALDIFGHAPASALAFGWLGADLKRVGLLSERPNVKDV